MMVTRLCLLILLVLLSACASSPNPVHLTQLEQPQEYRLQPGDVFDLKFFYSPELNETGVTVRPDGRISVQLANDVMVAGLTPAEATDLLRKRYSKEMENPEISLIMRSFSAHRVFVDGEVFKAGLIPLTGGMTLLQSISQAGGMKETARTDEVIVIRREPGQKVITMIMDLEKALEDKDLTQDIMLKPNDVVFVPRSTIADVNVWVDQYLRRNIPIPIGVSAYAGGV